MSFHGEVVVEPAEKKKKMRTNTQGGKKPEVSCLHILPRKLIVLKKRQRPSGAQSLANGQEESRVETLAERQGFRPVPSIDRAEQIVGRERRGVERVLLAGLAYEEPVPVSVGGRQLT